MSATRDGKRYPSPAGNVVITKVANKVSLHVGEGALDLKTFAAEIDRVQGNWFLIRLNSGGNACEATFRWLNTTNGHTKITDPFGTCSAGYDWSFENGKAIMEMHGAPSEGRVAFSYDGEIIQKTNLGFEDRL